MIFDCNKLINRCLDFLKDILIFGVVDFVYG